uniref:Uncharacterized protein LOC102805134 n=1 Tax=Saccoglossus kowalevskii TaxID=10224 RepID=A0ABM0MP25_SACKO|nr:PREDICTED: uncharacterized protein LOC102805134 [Saccoglossus kowalevskii]
MDSSGAGQLSQTQKAPALMTGDGHRRERHATVTPSTFSLSTASFNLDVITSSGEDLCRSGNIEEDIDPFGCYGNYTSSSGVIKFPLSDEDDYPNNMNCIWVISVSQGSRIRLTFPRFDIEGVNKCMPNDENNCRYDELNIYDVISDTEQNKLLHWCGNEPPHKDIISDGNMIIINFLSDDSVRKAGFHLSYDEISIDAKCPDSFGHLLQPSYREELCFHDHALYIDTSLRMPCSGTVTGWETFTTNLNLGSQLSVGIYRMTSDPWIFTEIGMNDIAVTLLMHNAQQVVPIERRKQIEFQKNDFIGFEIKGQSSIAHTYHHQCMTDNFLYRIDGDYANNASFDLRSAHVTTSNAVFAIRATFTESCDLDSFSGCGGLRNLQDPSCGRYFESINYPEHYIGDVTCSWDIAVSQGAYVMLNFVTFDLQPPDNDELCLDYVSVFTVHEESLTELVRYCGFGAKTLMAPSDRIHVNFVSDSSGHYPGFRAVIEECGCGCDLTVSVSGQYLQSPSTALAVINDPMMCTWHLRLSRADIDLYVVLLHLTKVKLDNTDSCHNFILVEDVSGGEKKTLTKICDISDVTQLGYQSSGPEMFISFKIVSGGFLENHFQAVHQEVAKVMQSCSDIFVDSENMTAVLKVPQNSGQYANYMNCTWEIELNVTGELSFYFEEFSLEPDSVHTQNCVHDYIDIVVEGQGVGRYCGDSLRKELLIIESSKATIHMYTDATVVDVGFTLYVVENYHHPATDPCLAEHECSHICVKDNYGYHCACPNGYFISGTNKHVCESICLRMSTSFAYPNLTNMNKACVFILEVRKNWHDAKDECSHRGSDLFDPRTVNDIGDWIANQTDINEFWIGDTTNDVTICSILSFSGEPLLSIKSCEENYASLCYLRYQRSSCEGRRTLTAPFGIIESSIYFTNTSCSWLIQGLEGSQLRLLFTKLKLRCVSSTVCVDHVTVYDGNTDSNMIGQYCGMLDYELEVVSTSSNLYIVFVPGMFDEDLQHGDYGFQALYQLTDDSVGVSTSGCGGPGYVTGMRGTITSGEYLSYSRCQWTILGEVGKFISLKFRNFHLAKTEGKCIDTVSIYSGYHSDYREMAGEFCTEQALTIIISEPVVVIRLKSVRAPVNKDENNNHGPNNDEDEEEEEDLGPYRFDLDYEIVDCPGCDHVLTECTDVISCESEQCGMIAFTNYIEQLPTSWYLIGPRGNYVKITIPAEQFQVEPRDNGVGCQTDMLEFLDGDSTGEVIGQFCNIDPPPDIILSSKNKMFIRFFTEWEEFDKTMFLLQFEFLEYQSSGNQGGGEIRIGDCPDNDWSYYNDKCYVFIQEDKPLTWNQAEHRCDQRNKGSHLISIGDRKEMIFIHTMLTTKWLSELPQIYIGLTDREREGTYRWSDGSPLSYADWGLNEYGTQQPSGGSYENCAMIDLSNYYSTSHWQDVPCASDKLSQYICKTEANIQEDYDVTHETTTLSLVNKECEEYWYLFGELCYRLYMSPDTVSLKNSRTICEENGGGIAIMTTQQLKDFTVFNIEYVWTSEKLRPRFIVIETMPEDINTDEDNCQSCSGGNVICIMMDEKHNWERIPCTNDGLGEGVGVICEKATRDHVYVDCGEEYHQCNNGECILPMMSCDGHMDCRDQSDEMNCAYPLCGADQFTCQNGECLNQTKVCDLYQDCIDGSDEDDAVCTITDCQGFRCYDDQCIPSFAVCDGMIDCQGTVGEDEDQGCEISLCNNITDLRCANQHCTDRKHLCINDYNDIKSRDYQVGCRDVTHLRYCDAFSCPLNTLKCPNSYCIPLRLRCNGVADCPRGEDELDCDSFTCPGAYKCFDVDYCVPLLQRCDGIQQCKYGDDEQFCDITCPDECECQGFVVICHISYGSTIPHNIPDNVRKLAIGDMMSRRKSGVKTVANVTYITLRHGDFMNYHFLGELDMSHTGIEYIPAGIFSNLSNLYHLDVSHNNIEIIYSYTFTGLHQLKSLRLRGNPLKVIEDVAFVGLDNLPILDLGSLQLQTLTNNVFIGLDALRILNISDNNIVVGEESNFFYLLDNMNTLYSDKYSFCCLANRKQANTPLLECTPPPDEFSSCRDLMANSVLRSCMWILGFSALIGNLFVIIWRLKSKEANQVHAFLILNLGFADFLMGVYMIIIASVDMYYRGIYIVYDEMWRHSALCQTAGFLSTVSSEVSVFTLTVITADRFFSLVFPLRIRRLTAKRAKIICTIGWVIIITAAFIPITPIPYFNGEFYARAGVCLSLQLTHKKPPGWQYSVTIFQIINLVSFIFIFIAYIIIFNVIKQSTRAEFIFPVRCLHGRLCSYCH